MMKNSDYWRKRFVQMENAQNQLASKNCADIEKFYRDAQKQLEGQIARWYQRFADNNKISMAEARKWLTGADLDEFKWDVQDYIKYGEENAVNHQWIKQLENASAKWHISRLEALKIQTQHSLEVLTGKYMNTVSEAMSDIYTSGYYHTAYEIQKGIGIGRDIAGLNQSQIEKVLAKPWAADGYNFSERIWNNKDKLIQEIHTELSRNIMLGQDPQKAIDAIAKKMNVSKTSAGRLVMTEEAYFSSAAQKECFRELDVEKYEIVATIDSHTSDICQSMDGKVFPMSEYEAGVTAPPFHVNCRSVAAPYFDEDFGQTGARAARDAEGNTYYIPANMTYKEWKETFVDGGDKAGLDIASESGIISEADIQIMRSVGAAAYRDEVKLPNGQTGKIAEGSKITKVYTFAGKGTNKPVKVANYLSKQYKGVPESEWKKVRGDGYVEYPTGEIKHTELHWFESEQTGRIKMKVKREFKR